MTNSAIEQFIVTQYDKALAAADGAVAIAQTRASIIPAVATYLESADRDYEAEAGVYVKAVLDKERETRSKQLRKDLELFLDYVEDPENGAFSVQFYMQRAYRLGTADGQDAVLAKWTAQDFGALVVSRYRKAAEATAEAVKVDETVQRIVDLMESRGANEFGDIEAILHDEDEAA